MHIHPKLNYLNCYCYLKLLKEYIPVIVLYGLPKYTVGYVPNMNLNLNKGTIEFVINAYIIKAYRIK